MSTPDPHSLAQPSPWLLRWAHLLAPGSSVLDVACGSGRHVRWLAQRGYRVLALDRDEQALLPLRELAEVVVADIETGPWPLAGRRFDAVLVTNYLWRPLMPQLAQSLSPGGVLIYETFALGHEKLGRPRNPEFLLQPGELLRCFAGHPLGGPANLKQARPAALSVVAYEDGLEPQRRVQRIVAKAPVGQASINPGATDEPSKLEDFVSAR